MIPRDSPLEHRRMDQQSRFRCPSSLVRAQPIQVTVRTSRTGTKRIGHLRVQLTSPTIRCCDFRTAIRTIGVNSAIDSLHPFTGPPTVTARPRTRLGRRSLRRPGRSTSQSACEGAKCSVTSEPSATTLVLLSATLVRSHPRAILP